MMHPSTMKLVDRLRAMTAQGKIEWADGEDAESLVYVTEGYRVVLSGNPANISLTDNSGNELEKVEADELAQTQHADGGAYDAVVVSLVADARRIARGTESAINSVLEGLDLDGDGVVDIPMEDGLVPTPAEIADPQPDTVEDTADESGTATLADADVNDMSKAVASLADQVNETEEQRLHAESMDGANHDTPPPAALAAAGLGAAGLVAASQIEAKSGDASLPQMEDIDISTGENFDLKAAEPEELEAAPLKLDTEQSEVTPASPPEEIGTDTGFVPPQPGEVLSLSGLTKDKHQNTPVMAGTATTMPSFGESNIEAPLPAQTVSAPVDPAPTAPPPPMPEPAAQEETSEPEAEAVEPTPEADTEEPAAPVSNSKFNPWI